MRRHGPWTITQSAKIYEDSWLRLDLDQVIRPDGLPGTYTTVQLKPGVTVIALDEQENVHLTSEFHYAVGRVTLEGVSGGIEPHEPPLVCAKRELVEELGIIAGQWTHLGTVDPFTGSIRSPVELYLAEQLAFTDASPEGSELIDRVSMPLAEAIEHVMDNRITHAPSCVALLKIWHRRQQT